MDYKKALQNEIKMNNLLFNAARGEVCSLPDCSNTLYSDGLCFTHLTEQQEALEEVLAERDTDREAHISDEDLDELLTEMYDQERLIDNQIDDERL